MSDVKYFDLSISAPKRLAMMRKDFAAHPTRYPNCPEHFKPNDWKSVRGSTLKSYRGYFGLASVNASGEVYSFDAQSLPVRELLNAHDILDNGTTGYYADCAGFGDMGAVIGRVARLSHGRFIVGHEWTDNGEISLFPNEGIFTNEREAARRADSLADTYAESLRDDDGRFQAMTQAETACDDKESEFRSAWADYRAIVAAAMHSPARFAALASERREEIREIVESLRVMREELKTRTTAYENGGK